MLLLEIGPPELDLMKPLLSARPRVRILATCPRKFGSDLLNFETFDVQELNDLTLLQLHRSDTFQLFTICISEMPAIFSRARPKLLQDPSIPLAIDDPNLNPPGIGEDH
jgi:hypothetical protein